MRRTYILIIAGFLILGAWLLFDGKKTDSYFTFEGKNIVTNLVFEGKKGLSYDYKIPSQDVDKISTELLSSNKKKIKTKNLSYPSDAAILQIFLDGNIINNDNDKSRTINANREFLLIQNNGNSVYIIAKIKDDKTGETIETAYLINSKWLSDYLKETRTALK